MHFPRDISRRALLGGLSATLAGGASVGTGGSAFGRPGEQQRSATPRPSAKISPAALRFLESGIAGNNVLTPGQSSFTASSRPNNLRYRDLQPIAIARCGTPEEVAHAVKWAIETGVDFAARSGGHSYAGYSMTDGLMIDVSRMRQVTYDPANTTVDIAAGARTGSLFAGLKPIGRTLTHARCQSVGAAGFLLGGGIGFGARDLGLACDGMIETDIVLADGTIVTANAKDHPDLYWACRGGGGGNFGINTRFRLATVPAEPVTVFKIVWRQRPEEVLTALLKALHTAPDRFGSRILLTTVSSRAHQAGRDCAVDLTGQLRGPIDELKAILAPVEGIAAPASAKIEHQPYWAAQPLLSEEGDPGYFQERSRFVDGAVPDRAIGLLMDFARRGPGTSQSSQLKFFQVGGKIKTVAPTETAYVHRHADWLFVAATEWSRDDGPQTVERAQEWLDGVYDTMRGRLGPSAYQNFVDPSLKSWQTAYYGANLSRLRQVKARVDPEFRFKFAQAIPPAITTSAAKEE